MQGSDHCSELAAAHILLDLSRGFQGPTLANLLGAGSNSVFDHGTTAPSGERPQPVALAHSALTDHIQPKFNNQLSSLSNSAVSTILNSKRNSTQQRYKNKIYLWKEYCKTHSECYNEPKIVSVLNYLSSLKDKGLSYNTVGISRSAISSICNLIDGFPVGSHPLISKFMKGLGFEKPKLPKYSSTWDINLVLKTLSSDR